MTRLALITGGHRGIGLGIAQALAADGWALALASEVAPDDQEVAAALGALPGAQYYQLDVTDTQCHAAVLDRVEAAQGPLTSLVSNAGVPAMVRGDLLDMGTDSFDRCIAVNTRGTFFLAQASAKRLLAAPETHHKSMIFVTSVSATMASLGRGEYCMSKAAAAMAVQLFALRLAPHGIGVYELRPGIIDTPMTAGVKDRYTTEIENGLVPARRWGTPADIGGAVLPLANGQMPFATGSAIALDGALSVAHF